MVNKTQFYKSKICLSVQFALSDKYFYSDKEEGASGAVDDGYGYLDAPSKE